MTLNATNRIYLTLQSTTTKTKWKVNPITKHVVALQPKNDYYVVHTPKTHKIPDFNLSDGCSYTDIVQFFTKWSQIGVHRLKLGQIVAKLQGAFFLKAPQHKSKHVKFNQPIRKLLSTNRNIVIFLNIFDPNSHKLMD